MYDITDQNSFINLINWIRQIEAIAKTNVCIVLVGNKVDKPDRVITKEEGWKFSKDYNMELFESSAKVNQNVNEVFNYLIGEILKVKEGKNKNRNNILKLCKFLNY